MLTIEEMEGTPQKGLSLPRTIEAIISIVRASKGEPAPTRRESSVTVQQMMSLFHDDLTPPAARPATSEAQERIDIDQLRRALYARD